MAAKDQFRQHYQHLRDSISLEDRATWNTILNQKIRDYILLAKPKVVHIYLPIGSEIDLYPTIQFMLDNSIKVVCPEALRRPSMKHWILESLDSLKEGKFGTKFPKRESEFTGAYDLIIVPGLAYNKDFFRLGYGGGYYDHFLRTQSVTMKIGLFYSIQYAEDLPIDPHDIPLDMVITDTHTYQCHI